MSVILTRQTKFDIRESNIAVLGRPELQAKYEGKSQDQVWENAGKASGVNIWRADNSKLAAWPDQLGKEVWRHWDRYGFFYDEDAYLVLHTYKREDSDPTFTYDIYYWVSQRATEDDIATVAYKSVELDEYLGKRAVQYREAQGHESEPFLALFPRFMALRGGASTQWHHPAAWIDPGVRKIYRMWTSTYKVHKDLHPHDEKQKQIIAYELPFENLEIERGGLYVYDSRDKIALYCTKAAGSWERFWVGDMTMYLGYIRTCFSNNFAHYDEDTPGDTEFMKLIGVESVTPLHSRVYDHTVGPAAQLYRLAQTDPRLAFSLVPSPTLAALDAKAVYVLDDYGNAHYPVVYVWVGKDATDPQARFALVYGEEYLKEKRAREGERVSLSVTVVKMRQGQETPLFLKALGAEAKT